MRFALESPPARATAAAAARRAAASPPEKENLQCAHYVPLDPGNGACVYISYQCKGTFRNLRENLSAMAFIQDL